MNKGFLVMPELSPEEVLKLKNEIKENFNSNARQTIILPNQVVEAKEEELILRADQLLEQIKWEEERKHRKYSISRPGDTTKTWEARRQFNKCIDEGREVPPKLYEQIALIEYQDQNRDREDEARKIEEIKAAEFARVKAQEEKAEELSRAYKTQQKIEETRRKNNEIANMMSSWEDAALETEQIERDTIRGRIEEIHASNKPKSVKSDRLPPSRRNDSELKLYYEKPTKIGLWIARLRRKFNDWWRYDS